MWALVKIIPFGLTITPLPVIGWSKPRLSVEQIILTIVCLAFWLSSIGDMAGAAGMVFSGAGSIGENTDGVCVFGAENFGAGVFAFSFRVIALNGADGDISFTDISSAGF